MKRKDLVDLLKKAGFVFDRHGGGHDIFKRGNEIEIIPRHKEINEALAKLIIRKRGL